MSRSRSSPPASRATAPPALELDSLARYVGNDVTSAVTIVSAGIAYVSPGARVPGMTLSTMFVSITVFITSGATTPKTDPGGTTLLTLVSFTPETSIVVGVVTTMGVALGAAPMNVPSWRSRSSKKSTCARLPSPAVFFSANICDSAGDMTCSSVRRVLQYPSPRDGIVSMFRAHATGAIFVRSGFTDARAASPAGGQRHPLACAAWSNAQHSVSSRVDTSEFSLTPPQTCGARDTYSAHDIRLNSCVPPS